MREVRAIRMIRLFKEGYEQGGVLSNNDIAMLLNVSPSTKPLQGFQGQRGEAPL
jgi:Mn-dependent DtxR family transcriptional regulator